MRLIGFALSLALAALSSGATHDGAPAITVHVYNYAQLDGGRLDQAKREAARIYAKAGVSTEWVDCPLSPAEADRYTACDQPVSPTRLALRVISGEMAQRMRLPRMSFGRSWLAEDGSFSRVAAVCAHRAAELASKIQSSEETILGHLMAHEIGHLLLGTGSHAPTGIMHVPWYPKELELLCQGRMYFNSKQAKKIRAGVRQRNEAARSELVN